MEDPPASEVKNNDVTTTTVEKNGDHKDDNDKNEVVITNEVNVLEQKIIQQIEFYFGDANLPRDKFMLEQVKLDDGWIPMSTMLKFQRLTRLSSDADVILNALKHSQLMEVDTSGAEPKLRRSPEMPLPELNAERRKSIMERTVYAKRFPLDSDLDAVMAVVNSFATPENIYMRKYKDNITQKYKFKGSIFVTFKTVEDAKTFLDKDIKVGDDNLTKMWQMDYNEMKRKDAELKANIKKNQLKVKKEKENVKIPELKKGATIHMDGNFEAIKREDISQLFEENEIPRAYISYNKGDKVAFVRLPEENSAKPALEKLTEEVTIGEAKLKLRILEGEEEEAYLKQAGEDKANYMQKCKNSKFAKMGGRGRGGRKQNFKRRGGRKCDDEPPLKKEAP